MLDKLNDIADQLVSLIAKHDPKAKKPFAPEELPEEQAEADAAAKAEKSVRKSMGGLKEPK